MNLHFYNQKIQPLTFFLLGAECYFSFCFLPLWVLFSSLERAELCLSRDSDKHQIQIRICQASFRLLYLSCPFLSALNWLPSVSVSPEGAVSPQHCQWLTILAVLQLSCILSRCLLMAVFSKCFKSGIMHAWQFGLYTSSIKSSCSAELISHILHPAD